MRVASIEGHLRAALDGDFLISVDEAGPGVVIKVEHSHFLFDESTGELLLQQRASTKITFPNVRADVIFTNASRASYLCLF